MAKVIFRKGLWQQIPVLSTLISLLSKSLYSGENFERVIRETYGEGSTMLQPSYATAIGTRIILPAARCPDPLLLLFTNYNRKVDGERKLGKIGQP